MITEVRNKDELRSMINSLAIDSNELDDVISDLRMQISRVRNYDRIDMKTNGRILKNNLDQIKT